MSYDKFFGPVSQEQGTGTTDTVVGCEARTGPPEIESEPIPDFLRRNPDGSFMFPDATVPVTPAPPPENMLEKWAAEELQQKIDAGNARDDAVRESILREEAAAKKNKTRERLLKAGFIKTE